MCILEARGGEARPHDVGRLTMTSGTEEKTFTIERAHALLHEGEGREATIINKREATWCFL